MNEKKGNTGGIKKYSFAGKQEFYLLLIKSIFDEGVDQFVKLIAFL
jgi:hypothetical protein